jgi:hypothetical protein
LWNETPPLSYIGATQVYKADWDMTNDFVQTLSSELLDLREGGANDKKGSKSLDEFLGEMKKRHRPVELTYLSLYDIKKNAWLSQIKTMGIMCCRFNDKTVRIRTESVDDGFVLVGDLQEHDSDDHREEIEREIEKREKALKAMEAVKIRKLLRN